jgi:hypothetical protein
MLPQFIIYALPSIIPQTKLHPLDRAPVTAAHIRVAQEVASGVLTIGPPPMAQGYGSEVSLTHDKDQSQWIPEEKVWTIHRFSVGEKLKR